MALPYAPDFSDGTITAARLQQLSDAINVRTVLHAVMSGSQALNTSSTTLQNVTELVVPVKAGRTYFGLLYPSTINSAALTEDVKFGATVPAGTTFHMNSIGPSTGGLGTLGSATATDVEFVSRLAATSGSTVVSWGVTTTIPSGGVIGLYVAVGDTDGNFQVQAAQNTSGANTVTIREGSRLILIPVA